MALLGLGLLACDPGAEATPTVTRPPEASTPGGLEVEVESRGPVEVRASTTVEHYTVSGDSLTELNAALAREGPQAPGIPHAAGLTEGRWSIEYRVRPEPGGGCDLESLTVTLDVTVTLPEHESPEALPEGVQQDWRDFVAEVRRHEAEHVRILEEGARRLREALLATVQQPVDGCDDLQAAIEQTWREQQRRIQEAQRAFHEREGHAVTLD